MKKLSEDEIRQFVLPSVTKALRIFVGLLVDRKFDNLSREFDLNCTKDEFQAAVESQEDNSHADGAFINPPEEAFVDIMCTDESDCSFASQPNCFPPGFSTHNVDIWLAYAEEQINIDFFLWNRNGRTDVTLHLTTTFPTRGEIQITGVDLLVM
jgi:hypothetical protein